MPQDVMSSASKPLKVKKTSISRGRSYASESDVPSYHPHHRFNEDSGESTLPLPIRNRLYELFGQIEREFEILYSENVNLQDKLDTLTEKIEQDLVDNRTSEFADGDGPVAGKPKRPSQTAQLIKTTQKLKVQTSKIVSSFKAPTVSCHLIREFCGHRDGIWEVSVSKTGQPYIGTACVDHTACIWSMDTGACVLQYHGHTGSVNSIRFHPTQELVATSSGDGTAHIWRTSVNTDGTLDKTRGPSDDEIDSDREDEDVEPLWQGNVVPNPVLTLNRHTNVVIAADWVAGGEELVTASWDRTALLHDALTGQMLQTLSGHDQELTNVCTHPAQRLVVTCSKDTTFRLWDLRESAHSVSVFQGHSETVTSATFVGSDKVVTGSDDRCVKVWDMKNMRSPLATIRTDAPVNGLSVSTRQQMMAVPQDNRHVRLYDLNGARLGRLPRSNRQGHHRMVCSAAWTDDSPIYNLFTCGFDRKVLAWQVTPLKETKEVRD